MLTVLGLGLLLTAQPSVVAPEGYQSLRTWVRQEGMVRLRLMESHLGCRLKEPLTITLIPAGSGENPPWAAGWARPGHLTIRVSDIRTFPALFDHELAHVVIWECSGYRSLPRWFEEGLAMHLAGEREPLWRRFYAALSGFPDLSSLNARFPDQEAHARLAYARSFYAVRAIIQSSGIEGIQNMLQMVKQGRPFEEALLMETGMNTRALDSMVKKRKRWSYVYLPLLTSSSFMWLALSLLFIVVYTRKRKRTLEIMASWEEEEHDDPDVPCH